MTILLTCSTKNEVFDQGVVLIVERTLLTLNAVIIATDVSADWFNSKIVAAKDESHIRRVGFDLSDTKE